MKFIEVKQGGSSASRNALRRKYGKNGGTAEGPDAAAIHQIPEQVGAVMDRLSLTQLMPREGEDGPPVEVLVDPQCVERAEVMLQAVGEGDAAPEPTRSLVAGQRAELATHGALLGCQNAAEALAEDLADTERAAAETEQACVQAFYARLDELLDGAELGEADRRQLKAAAAGPLRLREEAAARRTGEANLTRTASAEAQATLETAAREAHMKQTALDLQEDRPVSSADLAAALDTFHALEGSVQ